MGRKRSLIEKAKFRWKWHGNIFHPSTTLTTHKKELENFILLQDLKKFDVQNQIIDSENMSTFKSKQKERKQIANNK
ncbi:CLUMA_CG014123, isoform A [Clunio marinus]|uniref:CLUMA_CG014123, isoform A n=1 Tax=Clunio marinus TaxID=568069 RepID=A0A1J1IL37_9DIPT|nr:CLUMA_CG014123, isoform A [Clunio marinus]